MVRFEGVRIGVGFYLFFRSFNLEGGRFFKLKVEEEIIEKVSREMFI